jgi:hypothetical protein
VGVCLPAILLFLLFEARSREGEREAYVRYLRDIEKYMPPCQAASPEQNFQDGSVGARQWSNARNQLRKEFDFNSDFSLHDYVLHIGEMKGPRGRYHPAIYICLPQ